MLDWCRDREKCSIGAETGRNNLIPISRGQPTTVWEKIVRSQDRGTSPLLSRREQLDPNQEIGKEGLDPSTPQYPQSRRGNRKLDPATS